MLKTSIYSHVANLPTLVQRQSSSVGQCWYCFDWMRLWAPTPASTEPAGSYVKTTTKTKWKDGLDVRRPTLPQLLVFYARVPVCLIPSVTSVCQGVRRVQPYFHTCVGIATTRRCSRSFGPLGDGFAPSCERCGVMFFSIGTVMFSSSAHLHRFFPCSFDSLLHLSVCCSFSWNRR